MMKSLFVFALLLAVVLASKGGNYDNYGDVLMNGVGTAQNSNAANGVYYNSYPNMGPGSPKDVFYGSTASGEWTEPTNWWTGFEPRTVDNVFIDIDTQVDVTLSASRVVRSLTITLGNRVIVADGVTLVLANVRSACPEGNFVDPTTLQCGGCTGLGYQIFADQSFCLNCGDMMQIPNDDRTGCEWCAAGSIFGNNTSITTDPASACECCPPHTSSDGMGGECLCCPAGASSNGCDLCATCPDGFDSHECGECVVCLPSLRSLDCPMAGGDNCNGVGTCSNITDAFGLARDVCTCSANMGPACQVDSTYQTFAIDADMTTMYTLPFDYASFNFMQQMMTESGNDCDTCGHDSSRALPNGPTINIPADTLTIDANAAIKNLGLNTDFTGMGYVDPVANGPDGADATIFGFDFQVWDSSNNAAVQQNITGPYYINIPYDKIEGLVNPYALHVYYWNVEQMEWIDVNYHCTDFDQRIATIDDQGGFLSTAAFELSAQMHVFIVQSLNNWGDDDGTGDNSSAGEPFTGDTRPPTATTGVSGIVTAPSTENTNDAPVSIPQKVDFESSSSMITPSLLLLATILFFLL